MGKEVKDKKKELNNKTKQKFKITKELEKKDSKFNKKFFVFLGLVVIGIVVGVCVLVSSLKQINKTKMAESEPIISTLEDGTYYMMGISLDKSFEIEVQDEFSYEVFDKDEKKVEVFEEKSEGKITIKPANDTWKQGSTYTLKITNGKFTDSELKGASIVTFTTVRDASQSYKYNKNVEKVSRENVKITDNVVKTSKKMKVGEILVIEDSNDVVDAAYKITKINDDGTYETEVPTLEEVFSELDYYSMEYLDLSGIEANEELAAYLGSVAKQSIVDSLLLDVDAAAKLNVSYPKYDKKSKEVVFGISMDTNPGDKIFNKSFLKHHKFSTSYEVGIKVKAYNDLNFPYGWDTGVEFEIRQTIKSSINTESPTLDKAKNDFSDLIKGKTGINWLSDELYKIEKDDYGLDKEFGELSVPTSIPFVEVLFTTNMLMDFEIKGNIGADLTNTTKVSFGYSTKNKFYGNASTSNKMTASAMAEGKTRIGITAKAGIEIINVVNLVGTGSTGAYGDYKMSASSEMTVNKMTTTLETKVEAGVFAEIGAEVNIAGNKHKFKGWSKEWPKVTASVPYKAEVEVKTEPASKEEKKEETKKEETKKEETPTPTVTPSAPAEVYYTLNFYSYNECSGELSGYPHVVTSMKAKAGKTFNEARVEHCNSGGNFWLCPIDESLDWYNISYHNSTVKDKAAQYRILKMEYNNWINSGECEDIWKQQGNEECYNKNVSYYTRIGELEGYLYHHDESGNFNFTAPINSNIDLWIATGCGAA